MARVASTAAVAAVCASLSGAIAISRAVDYPFWQDEVGSARAITAPSLFSMLHAVVNTEQHPPGFYTLAWLLDRAGVPVVWDRLISILATVALSALVVAYARRLVPLWSAALAGLITALGWQFVAHGWELRPYMLFALACLLFVLALEWVVEQPTRGRLALTALAVAAGSMTHFFFLFTLAGGLIWLLSLRPRPPLRRLFTAIGLGLVPLLVWLPAFYKQYEGGGYRTNPDFRLASVFEAYSTLLLRSQPTGRWADVVAFLLLTLVLVGAIRLWRASDAGRLCALSAIVPVVAVAVVWRLGPHIFTVRNLIGAAPFVAVAIAAAIAALPRPLAIGGTAVAVALLVALYVHTRGPIVPAYDRVASALVREGWREQDPILLFGPTYAYLHPLDWYLPGSSRLEVSTLDGAPCERAFFVLVGVRARRLTAGGVTRRVGRVVIGRLPYRRTLGDYVRSRHGSVLATRYSRCARPRAA